MENINTKQINQFKQCKYILEKNKICNKLAHNNSPYCKEHYDLCYLKPVKLNIDKIINTIKKIQKG